MDDDELFWKFHGNAPKRAGEVKQFEQEAGFGVPIDYAEFLQRSDGGEGFIGPNAYVIFW